jgi:hypothetical protein
LDETAQPPGFGVAELAVMAVVDIDPKFSVEEFRERPVAEVEYVP